MFYCSVSDTDEALRVRFEICNALLQSEDGSKHGCNDWTARSAEEKHRSGGGLSCSLSDETLWHQEKNGEEKWPKKNLVKKQVERLILIYLHFVFTYKIKHFDIWSQSEVHTSPQDYWLVYRWSWQKGLQAFSNSNRNSYSILYTANATSLVTLQYSQCSTL